MKELALVLLVFLSGGAKPAQPEEELTLEEVRAMEMMEFLEVLDVLMDESFVNAALHEESQGVKSGQEEQNEGKEKSKK